jgi:hypothetical protein
MQVGCSLLNYITHVSTGLPVIRIEHGFCWLCSALGSSWFVPHSRESRNIFLINKRKPAMGGSGLARAGFCCCCFVFMSIFLIRYFLYIHFICYPKSSLYPSSSLLPYPPTPASWPWHSPVLGHTKFARPRGLSSQWWPIRPSSATCAARDTSSEGTWRDLVIAVSHEAMPGSGKYRSGCSQSSLRWNTEPPMVELQKAPKELKGSATL